MDRCKGAPVGGGRKIAAPQNRVGRDRSSPTHLYFYGSVPRTTVALVVQGNRGVKWPVEARPAGQVFRHGRSRWAARQVRIPTDGAGGACGEVVVEGVAMTVA